MPHRSYRNSGRVFRQRSTGLLCIWFEVGIPNAKSGLFRLPSTNNVHPQEVSSALESPIEFLHISDPFLNIICILWAGIVSCFLDRDREDLFPCCPYVFCRLSFLICEFVPFAKGGHISLDVYICKTCIRKQRSYLRTAVNIDVFQCKKLVKN